MKWLIAIVIMAVLTGVAFWFTRLPGPRQLDLVNNLIPGDGSAVLVRHDQIYDPEHRLKLDIWTPKIRTDAPLPVVIFMYGGGWHSGSKDDYAFVGRALASRGFITVLPDYRLYPGAKFPAFLEDCAKAVAWVDDHVAEFGGDRSSIFLAGQSAGAYNAVMLALDRQWLGREGKETSMIRGVAALAGPYDFYPFDSQRTRDSFGDYHAPEMTQPVNFVSADTPALLLATGTADSEVRPRNSQILASRILEAGGDAKLVEYADIGHLDIMMAVAKPFRYKAPVLDDMVDFFNARQHIATTK
ncbi:MAG: alpha/beta hydrolase [Parasphingorhabdus sp.]|nr:alpha/beta hydrolase [Parasphingorhabdus sp.]